MPKKIAIDIIESEEDLERIYQKTGGMLKKDRIKTLLYIKQGKYEYQSDIGKKLGRTEKTIRNWLQDYLRNGLADLLTVKSGGNNTRTIPQGVINFVGEKLTASNTTITSYIELQALITAEFHIDIAYGALYSLCRRKWKSKLKVARKSHHKKDEQAGELFKKPQKPV